MRLLKVNSNAVTIWPAVGQISSWAALEIWSWWGQCGSKG